MRDRLSMRDLAAALGVDGNTVRDWLKKACIEVAEDRYDDRLRVVTLADAQRLAELHARTLLPIPDEMPKTLTAALTIIARQAAAAAELEAKYAALLQRMQELESSQTPQTYAADHQTAFLPGPYVASARPGDAKQRPSRAAIAIVPKAREWVKLPEGYEAIPEFCRRHGWPVTTVDNAFQDGRLTATSGDWKYGWNGRGSVKKALNIEQQRALLAQYRSHSLYHPCEQQGCPCGGITDAGTAQREVESETLERMIELR